ncbi:MAG TPA: hypothetical protein VNF73_04820 [Candidatus Saccharimonadales bacterium]|nr:hypothetical protein [Candidatus Saccharimonadales bacterium]
MLIYGRRERSRAGWRWLAAALVSQSYHELEHVVKIAQRIQSGIDPAPGMLGNFFNLIWLHFTFNPILTVLMVGRS